MKQLQQREINLRENIIAPKITETERMVHLNWHEKVGLRNLKNVKGKCDVRLRLKYFRQQLVKFDAYKLRSSVTEVALSSM